MFNLHGNYLFVPKKGEGLSGKYYKLGKPGAYQNNSFVLIPYCNPLKQVIKSRFYPVLSIENLNNLNYKISSDKQQKIFLKAGTNKKTYVKKVTELKKHIQLGNIYEINYCVEFFADNVGIDPLSIFKKLCELTKAPYSVLLKLNDHFIICGSPELFLKKEGNILESKPIKGTSRRGKTIKEDRALKQALYKSTKERTENVMAVDVARNDLSHVAKRGTVKVNKLYNIETFATVHQMVSTVSCEVKNGTEFNDIIEATFPMASMTGAPKVRAMQLIDETENFERNYYSGSIGLIDEKGDFSLSVIIRSIFYNQKTKHLSICVGGAITYLSDPEKEYEECLLKANALLKALNAEIKKT